MNLLRLPLFWTKAKYFIRIWNGFPQSQKLFKKNGNTALLIHQQPAGMQSQFAIASDINLKIFTNDSLHCCISLHFRQACVKKEQMEKKKCNHINFRLLQFLITVTLNSIYFFVNMRKQNRLFIRFTTTYQTGSYWRFQ